MVIFAIFRADELNRRKSREIPTKSASKMSARLSPALATRSVPKNGGSNHRLVDDSEDPSHLLNVWLGELDSLQKVKKESNGLNLFKSFVCYCDHSN